MTCQKTGFSTCVTEIIEFPKKNLGFPTHLHSLPKPELVGVPTTVRCTRLHKRREQRGARVDTTSVTLHQFLCLLVFFLFLFLILSFNVCLHVTRTHTHISLLCGQFMLYPLQRTSTPEAFFFSHILSSTCPARKKDVTTQSMVLTRPKRHGYLKFVPCPVYINCLKTHADNTSIL